MNEPGAAKRDHLVVRQAELRRRRSSEIGDCARVAGRVRGLQVDEIGDCLQRCVEPVAREHDRERGLGRDHRVPGADRLEIPQDRVGVLAEECRRRGIELRAAALHRDRRRRVDPADPVRDLDELRELCQPRGDRDRVALQLARPAVPVPLLVCRAESIGHVVGEPELLGERARHRGVLRDHPVQVLVAGHHELEADSETLQRRCAGADATEHGRRAAHALELVVVLAGLHRDVVAEPFRLLVRVRVTADVDEQRRVVDGDALLLVRTRLLGDPQRDQALAQHVLHRLPEAEVDAERQRRDELGQPNARAIRIRMHAGRLRRGSCVAPI